MLSLDSGFKDGFGEVPRRRFAGRADSFSIGTP